MTSASMIHYSGASRVRDAVLNTLLNSLFLIRIIETLYRLYRIAYNLYNMRAVYFSACTRITNSFQTVILSSFIQIHSEYGAFLHFQHFLCTLKIGCINRKSALIHVFIHRHQFYIDSMRRLQ